MIHYLITRFKRGKITPLTTHNEFQLKAIEELNEWMEDNNPNEAIDLINVVRNWMIHNKYCILKYKIKNILHQIIRKD